MLAIELLAEGSLTKVAIAQQVKCSRQALYNWLEDEEFAAALDKRLQGRKKFVEKVLDGKLEFVIDSLLELATTCDNSRVKADVLKYLADRSLGKATQRMDVVASVADGHILEAKAIDQELLEFAEE